MLISFLQTSQEMCQVGDSSGEANKKNPALSALSTSPGSNLEFKEETVEQGTKLIAKHK